MTNTLSTDMTSTVSVNSDGEKVRYKMDCHVLHMVLIVIYYYLHSLLFPIIIQNRSKQKRIGALTI